MCAAAAGREVVHRREGSLGDALRGIEGPEPPTMAPPLGRRGRRRSSSSSSRRAVRPVRRDSGVRPRRGRVLGGLLGERRRHGQAAEVAPWEFAETVAEARAAALAVVVAAGGRGHGRSGHRAELGGACQLDVLVREPVDPLPHALRQRVYHPAIEQQRAHEDAATLGAKRREEGPLEEAAVVAGLAAAQPTEEGPGDKLAH